MATLKWIVCMRKIGTMAHHLDMKEPATCSLKHMMTEVSEEYQMFFNKPLQKFPEDVLPQAKQQVSSAITAARRPYLNPAADFDRQSQRSRRSYFKIRSSYFKITPKK